MVLIEALFKNVRPAFHGKNCQYQAQLMLAVSLIESLGKRRVLIGMSWIIKT